MLTALAMVAGLWGTLALYFAIREPAWLPVTAAGLFGLAMLSCLLVLPRRIGLPVSGCLFAAVFVWWFTLAPSNTRDWEPEYAETPTLQRDGDRVVFDNIRNATYRADGDVEPNYYTATVLLSELDEVDLVSSHWGNDAIAHVFLSFGFSSGQHLAISVETRRERGEAYSVLGGFFRRYELIYVVGDERDLIGARTDLRRESVYLYPLVANPDEIRRLFLSYVDRIDKLSTAPEFYNTLDNNCSTNVLQRASAAAAKNIPSSWMVLASGYNDQYIYNLGRMSHRLPFADLKRLSLIRRPPGAQPEDDFSTNIRLGLPG